MALRRRGWTGVIVGLVVIVALLWVAYWFAARYAANQALARIGANGAECSESAIGGFPFVLDVRCTGLALSRADEGVEAAVAEVEATAPLYRPGTVEAELTAPLVVTAADTGLALTASWSRATASASAWFGGLSGFGASFETLTAGTGNNPGIGIFDGLAAANLRTNIAPAGNGAFSLAAGTEALVVSRGNGSDLPPLDTEARLILEEVGSTLGTNPWETLLRWLSGTPSAKIESMRLAGEGAIVSADGTLSLSEEGLLNGSILFRWNDIARLADLIEAILPGTRERAEVPLQGLNAVSVPVETEDGPMRQTTLSFTDGVIWLGIFPLPIDPIPAVRF
jgi:hypothetical protein